MNELEKFAAIFPKVEDLRSKATRVVGPFMLGPTKRGGIFFSFHDKHLFSDISIEQLKIIRALIDCFLKEVVGE